MIISWFLIIFSIFNCAPASAETTVSLYESFAGNINFEMTGASLRRQSNSGNYCAVDPARSARLSNIPAGATILAAYLYWAGSGSPDNQVTFDGANVTASRDFDAAYMHGSRNLTFFSGFADVTSIVRAKGNGRYRLSGLSVNTGYPHCNSAAVLSGWSIVVIYEDSNEPLRVINVYDGFQLFRGSHIELYPDNFRVPADGCDDMGECKWGVLTWEGDEQNSDPYLGHSENLSVNGIRMQTPRNPINNQFNSTIDMMQGPIPSPPGRFRYGVDIDIYSPLPLNPGDTIATTRYESGGDLVLLSAEVFSVLNTEVADLSISKSHSGNFTVGRNETYTIQVSNNGPSQASGTIRVTDTLPAGLGYVSGSGTGWTFNASGQDVTCTHPGPLASGALPLELDITVNVGATAFPSVINTASVSNATFDNQPANNSADDATIVIDEFVSVTKTVTPISDPVNATTNPKAIPGATLQYEIIVTNTGSRPLDAHTILITDPLPDNLRLVLNNPIAPVTFIPGTSGLSLTPTNVGNDAPPQAYNDVALSNDGGGSFLPPGSIGVDPTTGLDTTDPKINFIRVNPKGIFQSASGGGPNPGFTLQFQVRLE